MTTEWLTDAVHRNGCSPSVRDSSSRQCSRAKYRLANLERMTNAVVDLESLDSLE